MNTGKKIFHLRTCFPIRMIYTKKKPVAVTEVKPRTLSERLEEEPMVVEADRDRGVMGLISQSLHDSMGNGPARHWTYAQVSSAIRDHRYADVFRIVYNTRVMNKLIEKQDYSPAKEEQLGADLAAAHFLLQIGAHVRLVGHEEYMTSNSMLRNNLPLTFDNSIKLEAIKLHKAEIFDNGYKSLRNLLCVTHFDASNNRFFNDAQLDRVFCQFGGTLESIDVSNCSSLTSSGLTTLARFRKLKHVRVDDLEQVAHLDFLCLLLKESTEGLIIEGNSLDSPEDHIKLDDASQTAEA